MGVRIIEEPHYLGSIVGPLILGNPQMVVKIFGVMDIREALEALLPYLYSRSLCFERLLPLRPSTRTIAAV